MWITQWSSAMHMLHHFSYDEEILEIIIIIILVLVVENIKIRVYF